MKKKMDKEQKSAFKLIGLQLPHKTTNEYSLSIKDCGNLWQQFEKEQVFDRVPDKISNEIYAVYFDYDKDETRPFSYFIGCKVDWNMEAPESLQSLEVPAQSYEKVTAKGVMTGCVTEAWEKIWNSDIRRKFGFDFEVYDERSRDWNDATIDIYVSING